MPEADQDHDAAAIEHLDVAVPCDRTKDCQRDAAWVARWRQLRFTCGCYVPSIELLCDVHRTELLDQLRGYLYCVTHRGAGPPIVRTLLSIEPL